MTQPQNGGKKKSPCTSTGCELIGREASKEEGNMGLNFSLQGCSKPEFPDRWIFVATSKLINNMYFCLEMVMQYQMRLCPVRSSVHFTWTEIICWIGFHKQDEQTDPCFLNLTGLGVNQATSSSALSNLGTFRYVQKPSSWCLANFVCDFF